jgi:hypothetical protein
MNVGTVIICHVAFRPMAALYLFSFMRIIFRIKLVSSSDSILVSGEVYYGIGVITKLDLFASILTVTWSFLVELLYTLTFVGKRFFVSSIFLDEVI